MMRLAAAAAAVAALLIADIHPVDAQVEVTRALAFGTVIAGVPTAIAPTSASAAEWRITGKLGLSGWISLTLPSSLGRAGGSETMAISFCATCGLVRIGNTNPVGATAFNPANGVLSLSVPVSSTIYVWLGATVSPLSNQRSGSYTGTVVLTTALLL